MYLVMIGIQDPITGPQAVCAGYAWFVETRSVCKLAAGQWHALCRPHGLLSSLLEKKHAGLAHCFHAKVARLYPSATPPQRGWAC